MYRLEFKAEANEHQIGKWFEDRWAVYDVLDEVERCQTSRCETSV